MRISNTYGTCALDAIRTHDTHFRRVVLYPLSYQGSFQLSRPAYALKPARIYHTGVLNFFNAEFLTSGMKVPELVLIVLVMGRGS